MVRCAPMLIDTHTHLDDARYESDREAMIARAREAGVDSMITIGCDLATSRSAVALANQYPFVYASIGVHPHEVKHIEARLVRRTPAAGARHHKGRGLRRDRSRLPLQPLCP